MVADTIETKKARVIKANYMLQAKVGMGPLDNSVVRRCQAVMEANTYDFGPLGRQYLTELESAIKRAKSNQISRDEAVEEMTKAVMQLKASASLFRYNLVGNLASIMLGFLESVRDIDADSISIVSAHHTTLKAIIIKRMEGDGGGHGKKLENELQEAIARYFAKRSS